MPCMHAVVQALQGIEDEIDLWARVGYSRGVTGTNDVAEGKAGI